MRRPSGEWQIPMLTISCPGTPSIRLPLNVISPDLGLINPEIVRNVVDLPAPFEPIKVTISPSLTVTYTSLTATILPRQLEYS